MPEEARAICHLFIEEMQNNEEIQEAERYALLSRAYQNLATLSQHIERERAQANAQALQQMQEREAARESVPGNPLRRETQEEPAAVMQDNLFASNDQQTHTETAKEAAPEEPAVEVPVMEAPAVEEPAIEELVTEEPAIEEVILEESATEETLVDAAESQREETIDLPDDSFQEEGEAVEATLDESVEQAPQDGIAPAGASGIVDPPFEEMDLSVLDLDADMATTNGKRAVFERNLAALKIVRHLDAMGNMPNEEERQVLEAYAGFGGLSEAFDGGNRAWRKEHEAIKSFLTETEFASARASTLNAFYTPPQLIEAVYQGLERAGFHGGNILDPSTGTGRFLRHMPTAMRAGSKCVGVELDSLTAGIARYVSSNAKILNKGFEKTAFPDDSFDLAISNVPFGNYIISNSRYEKNYFIHDFFLKQMLDQTRPGGLVVAITSHGTMDKKNPALRRELARKGELVRALRLPNPLFKGAGTEDVCTDLLIFKKREQKLAADAPMPSWTESVEQEKTFFNSKGKPIEAKYDLSAYFVEHPQDILGEATVKTSAYGLEPYVKGSDLETTLARVQEALGTLPQDLYHAPAEARPLPQEAEQRGEQKPFGFYEEDGKILYYAPDGKVEEKEWKKAQCDKARTLIQLRDTLREMFDAELHDCSDAELAQYQTRLSKLYNGYFKKYGRMHDDAFFMRQFPKDSAYGIVCSLEVDDENHKFQCLSDVFQKRTIHAYHAPEHADTPQDGLIISQQEKGNVDIPYIAQLTGMDEASVVHALEYREIYEDLAQGGYVSAEEYLSGDVREKIEQLEYMQQDAREDLTRAAERALLPNLVPAVPKENTPFTMEQFETWNAVKDLSDAEKITLFRPENRAFFYKAMQGMAYSHQKRYFDFLQEKAPDLYKETETPYFFFACAANQVSFDQPFNAAAKTFEQGLMKAGLMRYSVADSKIDIGYLAHAFAGREQSHEMPVLSHEERQAYHQDYARLLERTMEERTGAPFDALRGKIERAEKNKAALLKVKPKDLTAEEIKINLGATWIPTEDIEDFAREILGVSHYRPFIEFAEASSEWHLNDMKQLAGDTRDKVAMFSTYGAAGKSAVEILEATLNHRTLKIFRMDGEVKVPLPKETLLVAQKADAIRDAFVEWIFKNEERKSRLVAYYNRHFNNIVPRTYDGSNLVFPGMNVEIALKEHQKNAIARILYGGNTLLAHAVGAGKTFEMQASVMEAKRIGLCKKALMIMPKHLTAQFGAEFNRLYPNAKILVATEKDFASKEKRKAFCAKITSQEWDAVVASYQQFERLPLSHERQEKFLRDEIRTLVDAVKALKNQQGQRFSVKEGEAMIKRLQGKLERLVEAHATHQDEGLAFEQLGIDRLYIDEAHYYKNLGFLTHMQGLNSAGNQMTADLLAKLQYLNEITNERGVVFATGTPVSNSMAELYTMQRYLNPTRLKSQGLYNFDAWASTFGREVTTMEIDPAGTGFRSKTRFAQFNNLPELICMFREFADVQTAESLHLPVPDYQIEVVKANPSPLQQRLVESLADRAQRVRQGNPDKRRPDADEKTKAGMDNILTVIKDGMQAALDPRILNPDYADYAGSKVNLCVKNVLDLYGETNAKHSTQMIFCDLSTPNGKKGGFNVYEDIRAKLMDGGVPEKEIAFIHDYEKQEAKEALFEKVRKGEVRVLLGSSDKLGVGTNVQDKLIATHDLDCPWKPSQLEQRFGRIVRRGNENKNVKIFRYVTDATFDSYMWQTVERKQRFISQVMTTRTPAREAEDCDEFTMTCAQIKACCTGNPIYKEQFELQNDLQKLGAIRAQHMESQADAKERLRTSLPQHLAKIEERVQRLSSDMQRIEAGKSETGLTLNGRTFKTHAEIGKVLAACAKAIREGTLHATPKGTYGGMNVTIVKDSDTQKILLKLSGKTGIDLPIGSSTPEENANRLQNFAEQFKARLEENQDEQKKIQTEKAQYEKLVETPFPQEAEYQEKSARLREIVVQIEADENDSSQKEEKANRHALIENPDRYEGENPAVKRYLETANRLYRNNRSCYDWTLDQAACQSLLKEGISRAEISKALCAYSPLIHDSGTIEKLIPKQERALA